MKTIAVFVFGVLVFQHCSPRSLPEESVVSVYTPQPHPDVYQQIATNIADRITSPIYRFLGITKNATELTTTKPWDKIENLDEGEAKSKTINNNNIADTKDVEELSPDALKKKEKPEKITLYSSYLPTNEKIERNDTINEISDDDDDFGFDLDDKKDNKRGSSPIIYVLELIGTFIQLVYGGIVAYFSPKPT